MIFNLLTLLNLVGAAMAAAPVITDVKYAYRTLDTGGGRMGLQAFVLTFDQDLFINKPTISYVEMFGHRQPILNASVVGPLVGINTLDFETWFSFSQLIQGGVPFDLKCGRFSHIQPPSPEQQLPSPEQQPDPRGKSSDGRGGGGGGDGPKGYTFFPSVDDFLASFVAAATGNKDMIVPQPLKKNSLTLVAFYSMQQGDQTMIISGIPNLPEQLSAGNCSIAINGMFKNAQNEPVVTVAANLKPRPEPLCDSKSLNALVDTFQAVLKKQFSGNISQNAQSELQDKLLVLSASDTWLGCKRVLDQAIEIGERPGPAFGTDCTYKNKTDPNWISDPCCNPKLKLTQCCAPREITKMSKIMTGANSTFIALNCKTDEASVLQMVNTLQGLAGALVETEDPLTGCDAIRRSSLGGETDEWKAYETLSNFMKTCSADVEQYKKCKSDDDCYKTKCVRQQVTDADGQCFIDYKKQPLLLAECYFERMDTYVRLNLGNLLGMKDPNNFDEFQAKMLSLGTERCVGPSSWQFNGGYFQISQNKPETPLPVKNSDGSIPAMYYDYINNGYDYCQRWDGINTPEQLGCFYMPPSKEACLSSRSCNWNWSEKNQTLCEYDYSMNGGYFCGNGWEVSNPSICQFNSHMIRDDTCKELNGTIYTTRWKSTQCVSQISKSKDECFEDCAQGPNPLPPKYCYNKVISSSQCDSAGLASTRYWDFVNRKAEQLCIDYTNKTCANGMSAGWKYGVAFPNQFEQSCGNFFCYNKAITAEQCRLLNVNSWDYFWNQDLNGGQGACQRFMNFGFDLSTMKQQCLGQGDGWSFYPGKNYQRGQLDTQQLCEDVGMCSLDPDLTKEQCTTTLACSGYCPQCSTWNDYKDQGLCVHQNSTACEADQLKNYASWDDGRGYCVYKAESPAFASCQNVHGSTVIKCSDFSSSNYEQCSQSNALNNSWTEILQCNINWQRCPDEKSCEANGQCSDWELDGTRWDQSGKSEDSGVCVVPFDVSEYGGWLFCDYSKYQSYMLGWSRIGCVLKPQYGSPPISVDDCAGLGGEIRFRATNKTQCLGYKGCTTPDNPWSVKPMSLEACQQCKGKYDSIYTYWSPYWGYGRMQTYQWQKREMVPQNDWVVATDWSKSGQLLFNAISMRIAQVLSDSVQCKYKPLFFYMKQIACLCGTNPDSTCAAGGATSIDYGSQSALCNSTLTLFFGSIAVKIDPGSFSACTTRPSISVGSTTANTTGDGAGGGLTKRGYVELDKRALEVTAACFAQVQNSQGAYIGQLRGDCVSVSSSVTPFQLNICLTIKNSIPYDSSTYPNFAVATSGATITVAPQLQLVFSAGKYCVNVTQNGVYCPASVMNNYGNITSRAQPSCGLSNAALSAVTTAATQLAGSATTVKFPNNVVSSVAAGVSLGTITVQLVDSNGQLATDAVAPVTLSLKPGQGTPGAALKGTVRVNAVAGVATFTGVSVDTVGTNYQLVASAGNLVAAYSSAFTVVSGAPAALEFVTQPGGAVVNQVIRQAPVVQVVDIYGNVVKQAISITIQARQSGSPFASVTGTLSGSSDANSGRISFSSLTFTQQTTGITLQASSTGLSGATSNSFNVVSASGVAVALNFTSFTTATTVNTAFTAIVAAVDGLNVVAPSFSGLVSISAVTADSNQLTQDVDGVDQLNAISGSAPFAGLSISKPGYYFLIASASGLASVQSPKLAVDGPYELRFQVQPPTTVASGASFSVTFEVRGLTGTRFVADVFVLFNIKPGTGTQGAKLSVTSASINDGFGQVAGLTIDKAGSGYVLVAYIDKFDAFVESYPFDVTGSSGGSSATASGVSGSISGATTATTTTTTTATTTKQSGSESPEKFGTGILAGLLALVNMF